MKSLLWNGYHIALLCEMYPAIQIENSITFENMEDLLLLRMPVKWRGKSTVRRSWAIIYLGRMTVVRRKRIDN